MILRSKIELNFGVFSGTESAIIIGSLQNVTRTGQAFLGANYAYAKDLGNGQAQVVKQDAFKLESKAEILALNDMIKADLPVYEETEETYFEELKYMLAFRVVMVQTFSGLNPDLTINDIEIVDDNGQVIL